MHIWMIFVLYNMFLVKRGARHLHSEMIFAQNDYISQSNSAQLL